MRSELPITHDMLFCGTAWICSSLSQSQHFSAAFSLLLLKGDTFIYCRRGQSNLCHRECVMCWADSNTKYSHWWDETFQTEKQLLLWLLLDQTLTLHFIIQSLPLLAFIYLFTIVKSTYLVGSLLYSILNCGKQFIIRRFYVTSSYLLHLIIVYTESCRGFGSYL